ncbi:MAG TPA: manganese efflux pump MntP family protein [Polyangiaceae bacterium]|nr:manganese efflux pump MntP family protein [Polyangiaceae bacterium]
MKLGGIMLLAFGLSMDAMAVSAARGLSVGQIRARHVALVAGFFGGFQALMPLVGFLLGASVGKLIAAWDPWIILLVLGGIGGKMLWEAFHDSADTPELNEGDAFGLKVLLLLAIATSIDALAAGFTLPLLGAPLGLSLAAIGVTTAVLSAIGLFAGHRFGAALGSRLDALGGLVLIGIGVKTLVEHLGSGR